MNKKCERSYMEKKWARMLSKDIAESQWRKIYSCRIHSLSDNKLKEFMYKLIHNLIPCREMLVKWKKAIDIKCPICNEPETVKHVYFDCPCIGNVWQAIGCKLNIEITWTKVIMGYLVDIPIHRARNLLFTVLLYARYKMWSKSIENSVTVRDYLSILMNDVSKWNYLINVVTFDCNHDVFRAIWMKMDIIMILKNM